MKKTGICLVLSVILLATMTSFVSADNGGSASIVAQDSIGWTMSESIENALESAGFDVTRQPGRTAEQMITNDIGLGHRESIIHVFFYVGHGNREAIAGLDENGNGQFDENECVTGEQLRDALECDISKTILILDSCESGGAAQEAADACCTILTSSRFNEGVDPRFFTLKLTHALEGEADKEPYGNGDKKITLGEVHKYLLGKYDEKGMMVQAHHVYNGDTKNTENVVLSRITNFKLISPAEQIIEAGNEATFEFELTNNFGLEKIVEISAIWKQVKERGIVKLPPQWWGATIDGKGIPDEGISFTVTLGPSGTPEGTKVIEMIVSSSQAHEPGDFAKIEVSDPDGAITTSILTTTTIIPEFPTVAIPVLAILGLTFLMFRRNRHRRNN